MSVINATKMWSKTGGASTSEKRNKLNQVWSITEGWQVLTRLGDDIVTVWNSTRLPQHGDQHESGINAFVESITPTQIGPTFWQVIVAYSGQTLDPGTVKVKWTDTTTTEPIDRDFDGVPILTVNNEPVDGLSMDVSDQICVIQRQFLTIDTKAIAAYRRATNSDEFLGWPPGTARLIAFEADNSFMYGANQEQWSVTARIQFREPYANTLPAEAWYKRWRHEGYYVKDGDIIKRATDGQGQEMVKPVLLKEDGTQETDPSLAVFKHTKIYGSLPYSGLGLI